MSARSASPDEVRSAGSLTDNAFAWRLVDLAVAIAQRLRYERLRWLWPYLLVTPAVLAVGVLAAGLLFLFWRSIHAYDPFTGVQGGFSTEQFRQLFSPPSGDLNREAVIRTFEVSLSVTVVAVFVALPVAYVVVRVRRQSVRAVTLIALLAPFLMGEAPRAFGWSLLLGREGALTAVLGLVGIESSGLLGTTTATWVGLLQLSVCLGVLVALPAVRRIDPVLERAAQTLGAPPWQTWRHVIIPLALPGLLAASAIVFLLNVAELDLPQVVGLGRGPFAANLIRDIYTQQSNVNLGSAFSVVLVLLSTGTVLLVAALGGVVVKIRDRRRRVGSEAA